MHFLSQIIYSCKTLYMFRTVFPSITRISKLRIQPRYMSSSYCYLLLSGIAEGSNSCLTYAIAVYAVLSSWWWTESPSEKCRAFYKNKSFEKTGASCWLYYRNILQCTDLWILNLKAPFKYNECSELLMGTRLRPERNYDGGFGVFRNSERIWNVTLAEW